MQRFFSAKPVLAIAVALGSLAAASGAHAGVMSNAVVSVSVGAPVRHVQPAPVYVQPAPVYYESAPVYYGPSYYAAPAPVYYVRPGHRHHQRHWNERRHGGWR